MLKNEDVSRRIEYRTNQICALFQSFNFALGPAFVMLRGFLLSAALLAASAPQGALALVANGGAGPHPLRAPALRPRVAASPRVPACSAGGHGGGYVLRMRPRLHACACVPMPLCVILVQSRAEPVSGAAAEVGMEMAEATAFPCAIGRSISICSTQSRSPPGWSPVS
jgi:hypothetical protein